MSIDAEDEPQLDQIRSKLNQLLALHKGVKMFVTQGYICRNSRGEVTI